MKFTLARPTYYDFTDALRICQRGLATGFDAHILNDVAFIYTINEPMSRERLNEARAIMRRLSHQEHAL